MVERVTSPRTYVIVMLVLLALTAGTVAVSYVDLGPFHVAAALAFAIAKATLIVLFFMHARYSGPLTRLVMVVAIVWLGILVVGTMDDFLTRSWLGVPGH